MEWVEEVTSHLLQLEERAAQNECRNSSTVQQNLVLSLALSINPHSAVHVHNISLMSAT